MKFKYKFSITILIIIIAAFFLSAACFTLNLIKLINNSKMSIILTVSEYISIGLGMLLPIILTAIIIGVFIDSKYTVTDKYLYINWGILKDKHLLEDVTDIEVNNVNRKMIIKFKDESAAYIAVSPSDFKNFSTELMKKNKNIFYTEQSENGKGNLKK